MSEKFNLAGGWYLQRVEIFGEYHWVVCDPQGERLGDTAKHRAELDRALMAASRNN